MLRKDAEEDARKDAEEHARLKRKHDALCEIIDQKNEQLAIINDELRESRKSARKFLAFQGDSPFLGAGTGMAASNHDVFVIEDEDPNVCYLPPVTDGQDFGNDNDYNAGQPHSKAPMPQAFREFCRSNPQYVQAGHVVGSDAPYRDTVRVTILQKEVVVHFTQTASITPPAQECLPDTVSNAHVRCFYRIADAGLDRVHLDCFARDLIHCVQETFQEDRDLFYHLFTTEMVTKSASSSSDCHEGPMYAILSRLGNTSTVVCATVAWDYRNMSVELVCSTSHATNEKGDNKGAQWMPFVYEKSGTIFARDTVWSRPEIPSIADSDYYPPRFYTWMVWMELNLPPGTFPGGFEKRPAFRTLFD
jgi:hypothetical protein